MYHHVKQLMYTVRVGVPDPRFGNMLLEQFGGANGELAAAMQYTVQGLNCEDPDRKDLLMDIGTEEISHLEVVGTLARMHLKPTKPDRNAAAADPLVAIAGGVNLYNSVGNPWTADYLKTTGELVVDLRNDIAAGNSGLCSAPERRLIAGGRQDWPPDISPRENPGTAVSRRNPKSPSSPPA